MMMYTKKFEQLEGKKLAEKKGIILLLNQNTMKDIST